MELEHKADFPIAESGQIGVVQFVDLGSIDEKLATVGLVQSADDMQQSRFARSRSPDDAHDFFLVDMQVDALEHFEAAVGFMYASCLNHNRLFPHKLQNTNARL